MNAEQQAFARAYQRNVAIATKTEVEQFFDQLNTVEDPDNTIMVDYKWTSITDAWGVWWEGRRYEEVAV